MPSVVPNYPAPPHAYNRPWGRNSTKRPVTADVREIRKKIESATGRGRRRGNVSVKVEREGMDRERNHPPRLTRNSNNSDGTDRDNQADTCSHNDTLVGQR
jgi:hypothetical protein